MMPHIETDLPEWIALLKKGKTFEWFRYNDTDYTHSLVGYVGQSDSVGLIPFRDLPALIDHLEKLHPTHPVYYRAR